MVSGHAPSPEIQKIVIRLSAILTSEQIAIYTGLSFSAVDDILNYFNKYKTIKASEDKEERGRKERAGELRDVDIQVCYHLDRFCLALIFLVVLPASPMSFKNYWLENAEPPLQLQPQLQPQFHPLAWFPTW